MGFSKTDIEDVILSHGTRGMDRIRGAVPEDTAPAPRS